MGKKVTKNFGLPISVIFKTLPKENINPMSEN
jgi:hypothetical protein